MKSAINPRKKQFQKEFRRDARAAVKLLWEMLRSCKTLFLFYLLISVISGVVYFASLNFEELICCLSASTSTMWGVATSIFVHGGGSSHLVNNLVGLFFFFILFSITNIGLLANAKRIKIGFFIALVFVSGIISNIFWIMLMPFSHTSGLSGVVYAAEGVVLAISLSNTLSLLELRTLVNLERRRRTYLLWSMNFLIFFNIMTFLASNPDAFLSVGPRVNVFVHGISFLSAFCVAILTVRFKHALHYLNSEGQWKLKGLKIK